MVVMLPTSLDSRPPRRAETEHAPDKFTITEEIAVSISGWWEIEGVAIGPRTSKMRAGWLLIATGLVLGTVLLGSILSRPLRDWQWDDDIADEW